MIADKKTRQHLAQAIDLEAKFNLLTEENKHLTVINRDLEKEIVRGSIELNKAKKEIEALELKISLIPKIPVKQPKKKKTKSKD